MKRLFIIILVMGVCFPDSWAQDEITEENYLRQDSILWDCYYKREAELSRLWKELPEEKHDSLRQVYEKSLEYPPNCSRLTQQDLIIRELEEKCRSWADS